MKTEEIDEMARTAKHLLNEYGCIISSDPGNLTCICGLRKEVKDLADKIEGALTTAKLNSDKTRLSEVKFDCDCLLNEVNIATGIFN